jgi:hypothetical protein
MGLREGLIDFGSVRAKMGADAAVIQRENDGFQASGRQSSDAHLASGGGNPAVIVP